MRGATPGRIAITLLATALMAACGAAPAFGDFPYTRPAGDPHDFTDLYLGNEDPNDLGGDGNTFKFAATPDPGNGPTINDSAVELFGIRGASLADAADSAQTGVKVTLGRPDVTIAVMDSGIKWDDAGAMSDLRRKIRINRGELPVPQTAPGTPCVTASADPYDCNDDAVLDVDDYANDYRVDLNDPRRKGPPGVLVPQDLTIAFSDGTDADGNGFVDDIAGWDFLDNDNDPYDDVQYGHGTGEAKDSSSEANNGGQMGSCPNCRVIPMRVGDSFIADINRFAQGVLYAVDNNVQVVQSALGTLNNSSIARDAVNYAYRHGVTTVLSAADEAAQHNNQPYLAHTILVNSVTDSPLPATPTPPGKSYLMINGCTNFNAKITLAIPSTSCSSNAVGLAAGMAGLVYSAAYSAYQRNVLDPFPDTSLCQLTSSNPVSGSTRCLVTPNEVRQLMASGTIGGQTQADDVQFTSQLPGGGFEPSCSPVPAPSCTDPNLALQGQVNTNRLSLAGLEPVFQSYPARRGHDQFYGYGRVNVNRAVRAVLDDPANPVASKIPPDVEITSPEWNQQVNPANPGFTVTGQVYARGRSFTCQVYVAPGHYPNNGLTTDLPFPGDFKAVGNGACDGSTPHTGAIDGSLSTLDLNDLKSRFPPGTDFNGREPGLGVQTSNGRPNSDPYGFVVKVEATVAGPPVMKGEDRRAAYLHRDADMLPGFPKAIGRDGAGRHVINQGPPTGDGESSPVLADLDGDNRNELIIGGSDGWVHAVHRDGSELPGWPVRGDQPRLHTGGRAFASGAVSSDVGGAILASLAVADANRDGIPEVYAADNEGKLYGWNAAGQRVFTEQSNPAFGGGPLQPFVNSRHGKFNRTQHGFIGSPVIADLDNQGDMEVIAAAMDRHVYVWRSHDTSPSQPGGAAAVPGFPLLVVDPDKVASIDSQTDQVTFKSGVGTLMNGAIVDTPALADLTGDGKPEIVVGTNEEYNADDDGGLNVGVANGASTTLLDQARGGAADFQQQCRDNGGPDALCDNLEVPLSPANSRLYAIYPDGRDHPGDTDAFLPGWPTKLGILNAELLPVVGEGVTGYPVVGGATCPQGGGGPKVGALPNNGAGYIFNADGTSCYGDSGGADNPIQSDAYGNQLDHPLLPAVGLPAFADLDGTGLSFLAPAAGLNRALDVALPEYQRAGQDFLGAWSVAGGGQLRPNFPQAVNDLQFLTGPSVADLDGTGASQEILEGTASKDLAGFTAAGTPINQRWPKVTTDWTVANPTIGSWDSTDTDGSARKVVVALTRSGYINAYTSAAPSCTPSAWPRFHHDNANSGDTSRDATLPGKPTGLALSAGTLTFTAPGDDLLCGPAASYRIVTSRNPIRESNFRGATPLANPPNPGSPGGTERFALPSSAQRYVAVRAVDDQGNVGRVASLDTKGTGGKGGKDQRP